MTPSITGLKSDPTDWLLEETEPGVRYLALRDLLDIPRDEPELMEARKLAHSAGPIATVLGNRLPEGGWGRPGPGYNPKYRSTVWSIILLAQLGAQVDEDERVRQACDYLLEHTLLAGGQFTATGAPSGTIDCLQGNLVAALLEMGCADPRLDKACEWMARTVTGEGMAPKAEKNAERRYYAYKSGPNFACGVNYELPCGWGGTKVMLALGKIPPERRTDLINNAIQQGVEFFLSTDPARADWPSSGVRKPSPNWWRLGFPVFYVTDLLQVVEALAGLGYGRDPRLANVLELILKKQDGQARWPLEYDYTGKTWLDFGAKKQPNKWVTLRVLKVLKQVG